MITRIVKLSFSMTHHESFIELFNQTKDQIERVEGCRKVNLLRDNLNRNIFFTISHWDSANSLESYRESSLFKKTWTTIKPWFDEKPQAWTLQEIG